MVEILWINLIIIYLICLSWERMNSFKEQGVNGEEEPILEVETIKLEFPNMVTLNW